jgi:hypothetical protein
MQRLIDIDIEKETKELDNLGKNLIQELELNRDYSAKKSVFDTFLEKLKSIRLTEDPAIEQIVQKVIEKINQKNIQVLWISKRDVDNRVLTTFDYKISRFKGLVVSQDVADHKAVDQFLSKIITHVTCVTHWGQEFFLDKRGDQPRNYLLQTLSPQLASSDRYPKLKRLSIVGCCTAEMNAISATLYYTDDYKKMSAITPPAYCCVLEKKQAKLYFISEKEIKEIIEIQLSDKEIQFAEKLKTKTLKSAMVPLVLTAEETQKLQKTKMTLHKAIFDFNRDTLINNEKNVYVKNIEENDEDVVAYLQGLSGPKKKEVKQSAIKKLPFLRNIVMEVPEEPASNLALFAERIINQGRKDPIEVKGYIVAIDKFRNSLVPAPISYAYGRMGRSIIYRPWAHDQRLNKLKKIVAQLKDNDLNKKSIEKLQKLEDKQLADSLYHFEMLECLCAIFSWHPEEHLSYDASKIIVEGAYKKYSEEKDAKLESKIITEFTDNIKQLTALSKTIKKLTHDHFDAKHREGHLQKFRKMPDLAQLQSAVENFNQLVIFGEKSNSLLNEFEFLLKDDFLKNFKEMIQDIFKNYIADHPIEKLIANAIQMIINGLKENHFNKTMLGKWKDLENISELRALFIQLNKLEKILFPYKSAFQDFPQCLKVKIENAYERCILHDEAKQFEKIITELSFGLELFESLCRLKNKASKEKLKKVEGLYEFWYLLRKSEFEESDLERKYSIANIFSLFSVKNKKIINYLNFLEQSDLLNLYCDLEKSNHPDVANVIQEAIRRHVENPEDTTIESIIAKISSPIQKTKIISQLEVAKKQSKSMSQSLYKKSA